MRDHENIVAMSGYISCGLFFYLFNDTEGIIDVFF